MPKEKETIMAYIGPNLKKEAEEVLRDLDIPVSLLIETVYQQIAVTKTIPFDISKPPFKCLEDMNKEEFDEMMYEGIRSIEEEGTIPLETVFEDFKQIIGDEEIYNQLISKR